MKIIYLAFNLSAQGGVRAHNLAFYETLRGLGNDCRLVELRESSFFWKIYFAVRVFIAEMFFRPQLIIAGHINFSPLCLALKKIFGVKYAVTVHGTDSWGLKSKLKIAGLEGADKIISVSGYTAERLKKDVPAAGEKLIVIPCVAEPGRFKISGKPAGLISRYGLADDKVILTVARLSAEEKYKGYDKVIEALPAVLEKIPGAKYVLVGGGNDAERILVLIKKLNLGNSVILTGRVADEDLPDFYNLADVFVMPSKGEGFGIVFIEASASGIPVVAGNRDGSVDAVLGGKLGILVNPERAEGISGAIISLLEGSADRRLYDREYLRRETVENFGPETIKKRISLFLATLV